jgi:hypothetical protein
MEFTENAPMKPPEGSSLVGAFFILIPSKGKFLSKK